MHLAPPLREYVLPIAFDELVVYLRLALPKLAQLAASMDLKIAPLSRAETEHQCRAAPSRNDVFRWKKRALGVSDGTGTIALASGFLGRVFFNQTTPHFMLELLKKTLAENARAQA